MLRIRRTAGSALVRAVATLITLALPSLACAVQLTAFIPETAAGHALAAWLNAFNSGDRATFEVFKNAHAPWMSADDELARRANSGGYDLLSIGKHGKLWITFSAQEKATSAPISGALVVRPNDAGAISLLLLDPAGPEPDTVKVNTAERRRVIEGAAQRLVEFYVSPELGQKMAATLRAQQKRGEYQGIRDGNILATRLTDDLRALSHDKHVSVNFSWDVVPPDPTEQPDQSPDTDAGLKARLEASHCGFEKAEHLPPNIGYLKLNLFAEPAICAPTAQAAMASLVDSAALIIDLRDNKGGAPHMAALLSSYLFAVPTHLDDSYDRHKNTTERLWTLANVPGRKFTDKPVFVLTSRKTFSTAELFAYDLKNLNRATLIGETTGGGAHVVAPHRLDDHFFIEVPFGGFVNPVTGTDWEGTGVEPNIKVSAVDALDEALKRAREQAANTQPAH